MIFFNRDISWLSFNERVLQEAARPAVPLLERFRFLGIYSSNLDEFYRVRVPFYSRKKASEEEQATFEQIRAIVHNHQQFYGNIIRTQLMPALAELNIRLMYDAVIPEALSGPVGEYFFNHVAGYLEIINLDEKSGFFPLNNQLYKAILTRQGEIFTPRLINIPSNHLPRFQTFFLGDETYIIPLDDIIDQCLPLVFTGHDIIAACNIKLTRDASLQLIENEEGDTAELIEKQLSKRERGKATRFLYDPVMPITLLERLRHYFNLRKSALVAGGRYHNLKDLGNIPLNNGGFEYPTQRPLIKIRENFAESIFNVIARKDRLVHTPYHSYDCILRFFNEAAIDPQVRQIYVTFYRIASDSRIGHALISAAKNGKEVFVIVELKARFDEANNIRWAKSMKEAGIKIVYSENSLKVHAKIALIKRSPGFPLIGLLSTGNFNEKTARIYTDHVLLTAHQPMLNEVYALFQVLLTGKKLKQSGTLPLQHLLVAQFNLYSQFIFLIDREIANQRKGKTAGIIIKVNNLEEEALISKLYEASAAGVRIRLLVRGICRLVPEVRGQSENITVCRIVDRYLEHGRVFIFENEGRPCVYVGSADWMSRNIHHRIEVCFPLPDADLKKEMINLVELQLADNVQAVRLDAISANIPVTGGSPAVRSQQAIYEYLEAPERAEQGALPLV
jgi:polyphosphate kinase